MSNIADLCEELAELEKAPPPRKRRSSYSFGKLGPGHRCTCKDCNARRGKRETPAR